MISVIVSRKPIKAWHARNGRLSQYAMVWRKFKSYEFTKSYELSARTSRTISVHTAIDVLYLWSWEFIKFRICIDLTNNIQHKCIITYMCTSPPSHELDQWGPLSTWKINEKINKYCQLVYLPDGKCTKLRPVNIPL